MRIIFYISFIYCLTFAQSCNQNIDSKDSSSKQSEASADSSVVIYSKPDGNVPTTLSQVVSDKLDFADKLVIEKNTELALSIYDSILTLDVACSYRQRAKSGINLIENYSDCNKEPLSSYFEIKKLRDKIKYGTGFYQTDAEIKQELDEKYKSFLEQYPSCNLSPFVAYLQTFEYPRSTAEEKRILIDKYRMILSLYSSKVIPAIELDQCCEMGKCDVNFNIYIEPCIREQIAQIYYIESETDNSTLDLAIREYETIIENCPKALNEVGNHFAIQAYIALFFIYQGWNVNQEPDTVKIRQICRTLIDKYDNESYAFINLVGESHPEAYHWLADNETNLDKKVQLYQHIMATYDSSEGGQSGTCAVGPYWFNAFEAALELSNLVSAKMSFCNETISNNNFNEDIRGYAQYKLASFYEEQGNFERAIIEYDKVINNYNEPWIFGDHESLTEQANRQVKYLSQTYVKSDSI